jgi:signal transduction histidine kinase
MTHNFPSRILASAALSVVLAGVLLVLGMVLARPAIQHEVLSSALHNADLDACADDPASWGGSIGNMSLFAFDRSGRAANPDAPALEAELLQQMLASERTVKRDSRERTVWITPGVNDGPCAVIRASSANAAMSARPWLLTVLAVATIGGMVLAAASTFWLVVHPLRARIDALAVAARGVGTERFRPQPAAPDALGEIAQILAESHDRVLGTQGALEQRNRALADHLAGIAHDLRTPLSSMQLTLEAIVAESDGPLRNETRRALADVVYLSALVENLHEATRLRHEVDVSSGRVELTDLVLRLERRFTIVGRHADVVVAASVPERAVWAACTPALAERALANLIQNAIEHNPGPGHVAITLRLTDDDSRFEFVVMDDGPGLREDAVASLDEESFLIETARRRGPGLGMLITAEVARRAGWSLSYEPLEPTGLEARICGLVDVVQELDS